MSEKKSYEELATRFKVEELKERIEFNMPEAGEAGWEAEGEAKGKGSWK